MDSQAKKKKKAFSDNRCVFVEVIDGSAKKPYQVLIDETSPRGKTDMDLVIEAMQIEEPALRVIFEARAYYFMVESDFKPGKWVTVPEHRYPVDDNEEFRLIVTKCPIFELESQTANIQGSQSGSNKSMEAQSGNSQHSGSGQYYSLETNSFSGEATQRSLNITSYPGEATQRSVDITNSSGGSTQRSLGTNTSLASGSHVRNRPESHSSPGDEASDSYDHTGSVSSPEEILEEGADNSLLEVWPVSERSRKYDYVYLNEATFSLPTCFGSNIDVMLKDKSEPKKEVFLGVHYSAICRKLAGRIEETTIHPHPESIHFVVEKLLAKYPCLIINEKNKNSTAKILNDKLKRIFEDKRRTAKQQFSNKGGRPRLETIDEGPAAKMPRTDAESQVDTVSYIANVRKMLEVIRDQGSSDSVKALWLFTFEGRRLEIKDGKYADIYELMKNHCPVLNQANYLQDEFELLMGKGLCRKFMKNWTDLVPLILRVAKKRNDEAIKKVFRFYKNTDIKESFDTRACAAMELLPLLLPVRNKKNVNAVDYIYYAKENSASLPAVLKDTKGRQPFYYPYSADRGYFSRGC